MSFTSRRRVAMTAAAALSALALAACGSSDSGSSSGSGSSAAADGDPTLLKSGVLQGPVLGPNVNVGTGAKILGAVSLGESSVIGANAVVVDDVPDGAVVVGNPARVVRIRERLR